MRVQGTIIQALKIMEQQKNNMEHNITNLITTKMNSKHFIKNIKSIRLVVKILNQTIKLEDNQVFLVVLVNSFMIFSS
jgi:hypothetical protein